MLGITDIISLKKLFGVLLNPAVVIALMGFSLVFFAFMSIIFLHHWKAYSVDPARIKKAMRIYFVGGGVLLLIIFMTGAMNI